MRRVFTGLRALALVAAGVLLLGSAATAKPAEPPKVKVCHRPPGNPTNIQLISVGASAVPAHLAHGDTPVRPEICDGIDNDCDGSIDENATAEVCDGADNDCDGQIDEDFRVGEPCTDELNDCEYTGTRICAENGTGTTCAPPEEVCDGHDNNCSGVVDEGCVEGELSCPCSVLTPPPRRFQTMGLAGVYTMSTANARNWIHDVSKYYTWSSSGTAFDGTAKTEFLDRLNDEPTHDQANCFAGHCDWRLPSVGEDGGTRELETIVDRTQGYGGGGTSGASVYPALEPTRVSVYWSSTTYASDQDYAWIVNFTGGNVGYYTKTRSAEVRAVRGGS